MVIQTPPSSRTLLLLSQDRSQSSAGKTIHQLVYQRMRLLEVVNPPAQHGIKILDDLCQAVPTRALGSPSDALAQRFEALGPHPAPPRLEAIAEKIKTLPGLPTVPYMGLVRIDPKPVLFHPALHFYKRGLGLLRCAAEHHEG